MLFPIPFDRLWGLRLAVIVLGVVVHDGVSLSGKRGTDATVQSKKTQKSMNRGVSVTLPKRRSRRAVHA
jgi:hypothetical protein